MAAVRSLCWEYRDFLMANSDRDRALTETFYIEDRYRALLEGLETYHARPQGIVMLAEIDGQPVACGMSHPLDARTSEIKRVYVRPAARGAGVAAALCRALMDQARADGFDRVVLDTSKWLAGAQRLYDKLGFTRRGPYQPIPDEVVDDLVFFELAL